MTVEGSLDVFQLPEILQVIAQQQKTGILTVQGREDIVAISFLTGKVVGADSLNHTSEERLARILVRNHRVPAADMDRLLAQQQASGARLQDLLLDGNFLARAQLLEALRTQYMELMAQLLDWRQGDFKFYSNNEVSFEEGLRPLSVQELLLHAGGDAPAEVLSAGDDADTPLDEVVLDAMPPPASEQLELPALGAVFERVAVDRPIQVRPEGAGERTDDARVFLVSPLEHRLLQEIDGRQSVAGLIIGSTEDESLVLRGLARLRSLGLIRPPGEAPPAPLVPAGPDIPTWTEEDVAIPQAQPLRLETDQLLSIFGRAFAALLLLLLLIPLFTAPVWFELPFPWQDEQREAMVKEQRKTAYLSIDRAVKTFVLVRGQLPDDLTTLINLGLLSTDELRDPDGSLLEYQAQDGRYLLRPRSSGGEAEAGSTEAITGNFMLDPEFFAFEEASDQPSLILLD